MLAPASPVPPPTRPADPARSIASTLPARLLDELRAAVGPANVLHQASELLVYECDGFVIEKNAPDAVVFPTSRDQVIAVVQACARHQVPFVPRGAGTGLAGGTLPVGGGVMIALTRMKRILEINTRDRHAVVEPGVVNVWLARALAGRACTSPPTHQAREPARSAGTWRPTRGDRTPSSTASP